MGSSVDKGSGGLAIALFNALDSEGDREASDA